MSQPGDRKHGLLHMGKRSDMTGKVQILTAAIELLSSLCHDGTYATSWYKRDASLFASYNHAWIQWVQF